jgi:hypothetical protein
MRLCFLMILASIPGLDDCNPTPEQCGQAWATVRSEEFKCSAESQTVSEKRNNPTCQRAIEWHDTWIDKCRAKPE